MKKDTDLSNTLLENEEVDVNLKKNQFYKFMHKKKSNIRCQPLSANWPPRNCLDSTYSCSVKEKKEDCLNMLTLEDDYQVAATVAKKLENLKKNMHFFTETVKNWIICLNHR